MPAPRTSTDRMMKTKCFTGLASAAFWAQSGIESTGVNSPLIGRKMSITKKAMNIACCCFQRPARYDSVYFKTPPARACN
jgi:hypothetical protein